MQINFFYRLNCKYFTAKKILASSAFNGRGIAYTFYFHIIHL